MYIMNLLDNRTLAQMAKAYAMKQKSKVAKSPNMAVSGVTGKGDYPVKSAVVKTGQLTKGDTAKGQKEGLTYDSKGQARGFNMEYYARPEVKASVAKARAEQARKDAKAEKKRNSGFIGAGNRN